jgi:hypothetical protein
VAAIAQRQSPLFVVKLEAHVQIGLLLCIPVLSDYPGFRHFILLGNEV